jgi:hypothetical protein
VQEGGTSFLWSRTSLSFPFSHAQLKNNFTRLLHELITGSRHPHRLAVPKKQAVCTRFLAEVYVGSGFVFVSTVGIIPAETNERRWSFW